MEDNDYRDSHRERGYHYDTTLGSVAFDMYMDRWEEHHLMQILKRRFPTHAPRYLDFACGTGRITHRIEPFARESYGVDISSSMLDQARAKCRSTHFVCADVTREELDLGVFDLVTSFRFFGNAQDELRSAALAAISRYLRPGGFLIINNHRNPRSFFGMLYGSSARDEGLTHGKLRALLNRHGFSIKERLPIGFWIFRGRLATDEILESALAGRLEHVFRHGCFAPFSPDAIVVAQRK